MSSQFGNSAEEPSKVRLDGLNEGSVMGVGQDAQHDVPAGQQPPSESMP